MHAPHQARDPDAGAGLPRAERTTAVVRAMVADLDAGVARLLDALERRDRAGQTLVVFTSDNGAHSVRHSAGANDDLRGQKGMFTEGGLRVPLLLRWPAGLPGPAVFDAPVGFVDLLPTLLAAARHPGPVETDGVDWLPALRGEAPLAPRALVWASPDLETVAVREGAWKWREERAAGMGELHRLDADPGERRDLASETPDRVARMRAHADAYRTRMNEARAHAGASKP